MELSQEDKQKSLELAKKMLKVAENENPIIVANAGLIIIKLAEHLHLKDV